MIEKSLETEMLGTGIHGGICMYKTNPEIAPRRECPNCNGYKVGCPDYEEDKTRRRIIVTLSFKKAVIQE